jgi:cathepsin B
LKFEEGKDDSQSCDQIFASCEKYRVLDYCVSSEEESIKREIYKHGPVVAVIPVYKDFLVYRGGVYQVIEGTSRF